METTIISANESRFESAHYSEPLTAFTVGWKGKENLEGILDFIAPPVHVPRRFEFKKADNAECFISQTDDIRAIGSSFKQVEYTGTTVYEKTLNKGLTIRIDHDEIADESFEERYVGLLMERLYRNELRRAIALLSASAHNTDINIAVNGDICDPDGFVRQMLVRATDSSGIRPNRILFGESAWETRSLSYCSQETSGSLRALGFDLNLLAQSLMVDEIQILKTRHQVAPDRKANMLGREIYAFWGQTSPTKDEPSNLKRFVTSHSGTPFRVYKEQTAKYTDLTVEHYSNLVVTSTLGLEKLTIA